MLTRTIRLMESGIKPVYVFDGKPPELKLQELAARREKRDEAKANLAKAVEQGNAEQILKSTKMTVKVTKEQNEETKTLLRLMGVPVVEAPSEAEATCAALCRDGKVYAAATEDADCLTRGSGHQDPPEEGDQGREARDFRKNGHGEGEARQDHRQGLPREGPQGRVLRASGSLASPARRLRVCFSISSSCSSSIPHSEEYSCHFVQVGRRVRGHAWPSPVPGRSARAITCTPRLSRRTFGEGDHMYST